MSTFYPFNDSWPVGDDIGLLTASDLAESFVEDGNCFNATALEAVPSFAGQIFLITLYSITSLLALIGNLAVIIVELFGSESAPNIRKYLINLAVSDIILGVLCVPFTYTDFMLGRWIFSHFLCPTAQYFQLLSVFVTSLTLTIIGCERYMATLHPFSRLHRWLETRTHIMLAMTWLIGSFYAYIPYENTYTREFVLNNQTYYECSYDNDLSLVKRRIFMTSNFVLTFLLPLIVLICTYSAIMRKLISDQKRPQICYTANHNTRRSLPSASISASSNGNISPTGSQTTPEKMSSAENQKTSKKQSSSLFRVKIVSVFQIKRKQPSLPLPANSNGECLHSDSSASSTKKHCSTSNVELRRSTSANYRSKTIKMMFVVILLYGVCWMPIKLYQFLLDYGLIAYCTETQLYALVCLYFICHWVAMANSCINPLIYSFMSRSFRNDFGKITKRFRNTFAKNKQSQFSLNTVSTQV